MQRHAITYCQCEFPVQGLVKGGACFHEVHGPRAKIKIALAAGDAESPDPAVISLDRGTRQHLWQLGTFVSGDRDVLHAIGKLASQPQSAGGTVAIDDVKGKCCSGFWHPQTIIGARRSNHHHGNAA